MISINQLDIRYGDRHLFKDLAARINLNNKIGLVGVNGSGKSTLCKIIAGLIETDDGTVVRARRSSVAYLPQEATASPSGRSIYQEAETAFAETLAVQHDLDEINRQLSAVEPSSSEFAGLMRTQAELQFRLDETDIFQVGSEIEKVLIGLGFREKDFDISSRSLSGGWLMRLELAKLLLMRPALLLLDEPTNHLDLDSLTWLEDFLGAYHGSLVIISHDRTFLDKCTDITWELSLGRLNVFKGSYSKYIAEKEIRLQVERASYANQQAAIKQTMRFVERFRAKSTKAKQVQSRLKQLAKMERIELSETEQRITFSFPPAADCGRQVIEVETLEKNYGERQVFKDISFHLQRGDKMAVVGVNGAGKSTLMKIIAGLETATQGSLRFGHNAVMTYFGQHQAQELPPEFNVLETISMVAGSMTTTQIRSLLGAFLFRADEVEKKVRVLSGGEKSRLALAKMIVTPANLMVLDEPTNHLDMSSQDVLLEAMVQYDGSIIVVSHNRYFVNRFVNKVLEIKDGVGSLYEGNIDDYLAKKQQLRLVAEENRGAAHAGRPADETRKGGGQKGRAVRQEQARLRQEKSRRLEPCQTLVSKTEKEIEELESWKKDLEQQMADPGLYRDEQAFARCSRDYKTVARRLERQYLKWEEAQAEIEKIMSE